MLLHLSLHLSFRCPVKFRKQFVNFMLHTDVTKHYIFFQIHHDYVQWKDTEKNSRWNTKRNKKKLKVTDTLDLCFLSLFVCKIQMLALHDIVLKVNSVCWRPERDSWMWKTDCLQSLLSWLHSVT